MMKLILLSAVLSAAFTPGILHAQAPAAAKEASPAAEPSREAVEKYATELKGVIEKREISVTRIINNIKALDESIQGAIEKVLHILTAAKDSAKTGTKVAQLKEQAVAGLKRAAETYAQKRSAVAEELRTTKNEYRREDLFKSRGLLDDRIDKMVNSILQLALSMETDENHEKYIKDSSVMVGRGGIYVPSVHRNPEYDRSKKESARTDKVKTGIDKALESSLQRLDVQQRELTEKLKNPGLSEEEKTRLAADLERLKSIREEREQQQQLLLESEGAGPLQSELDSKDFAATDTLVDSIAAGARRDFARMMTEFNELRAERQSLADLKAKLDHAEKWLQAHPAK